MVVGVADAGRAVADRDEQVAVGVGDDGPAGVQMPASRAGGHGVGERAGARRCGSARRRGPCTRRSRRPCRRTGTQTRVSDDGQRAALLHDRGVDPGQVERLAERDRAGRGVQRTRAGAAAGAASTRPRRRPSCRRVVDRRAGDAERVDVAARPLALPARACRDASSTPAGRPSRRRRRCRSRWPRSSMPSDDDRRRVHRAVECERARHVHVPADRRHASLAYAGAVPVAVVARPVGEPRRGAAAVPAGGPAQLWPPSPRGRRGRRRCPTASTTRSRRR